MATTTNFGWETPDDTDLVKDGAAAIRTLGSAIDTSMMDLEGGTTGQILSKTSATDMDFTWVTANPGDITGVTAGTGISGGGTSGDVTVTNSMATAITTAGDLIKGTGSGTFNRLGIGSTSQVLTVVSGAPAWASVGSPSAVGASIYNAVGQSIPNSTYTTVLFEAENYDTDTFHSTSVNTGRMTIPSGKAGKYLLYANAYMASAASGSFTFRFNLNGAGNLGLFLQQAIHPTVATTYQYQTIQSLAVADYVTVDIYQGSGAALACSGANYGLIYLGA